MKTDHDPVAIPIRLLCVGAAALTGYVAFNVGMSGEFRSKGGVIELELWARCLLTAVLGLMALVASWVAYRGQA
jgi:hypothetical protein